MEKVKLSKIGLFLAFILVIFIGGCAAKVPKPPQDLQQVFLIGCTPNPVYIGIYAAIWEGYFSSQGLDVRLSDDSKEALLDGKADFVLMGQKELILDRADGKLLVSLAAILQPQSSKQYDLLLVSNEEIIMKKPKLVEGFLIALQRGYQFCFNNPQIMANKMASYLDRHLNSEELTYFEKLQELSTSSGNPWGWQEPIVWETAVQILRDEDSLTADFDINQAFTNQFIPGATEQAPT